MKRVEEIAALKMVQDELKRKVAKEITTLKKGTDRLVIEKEQIFSRRGEVKEVIAKACQHTHERTVELDDVTK